jgi:hypothetical protein
MTLAGFTAVLNVDRVRLSGGRLDTDAPFESGQIELSGHLIALKRGDMTRTYTPSQQHVVTVTVHFERTLPEPYIGVIQLWNEQSESADEKNRANVEVTLPIGMLSGIAALQHRLIRFDTVHEERVAPTVDRMFADIRRVYFDVVVEEPALPAAKRSWRWW